MRRIMILYMRGRKPAPFMARMRFDRSVFRFGKPRALARGASLILAIILIPMVLTFAEEMTITTYYPSPNGAYDAMNVKRLSVGDTNGDGNINASDVSSSNGYLLVADRMGIGTTSPVAPLAVTKVLYGGLGTYQNVNAAFNAGADVNLLIAGDLSGTSVPYLQSRAGGSASSIGSVNYKLALNPLGGNVGIGTVIPNARLDIEAPASNIFYAGTDADGLSIYSVGSGYADLVGINRAISAYNPVHIRALNGIQLFLNTDGNIGIGRTNPEAKLDLYKTGGYTSIRMQAGSDPGMSIGVDGDDSNKFKIGDSWNPTTGTHLTIDQSGNIGIGTTTPSQNLEVIGNMITASSDSTRGRYLGLFKGLGGLPGYSSDCYPTIRTDYSYLYFSVGGQYSAYMSANGTWSARSSRDFKENFTPVDMERILIKIDQLPITEWNYKGEASCRHIGPIAEDFQRLFRLNGENDKMISHIDPAGVALAGIKALSKKFAALKNSWMIDKNTGNVGIGTSSPAQKLHVAGNIKLDSGAIVSGTRSNFYLALQRDRNMVLYDNGSAVWNSGTYTSDIRLKKNVKTLDNVLDKLKRIRGVRFNWIDRSAGEKPEIGVIAQEVEEVFPDLVWTDPKSGYKLVKYEKLAPVLLQAIKEQQEEIEELRKEIRALRVKSVSRVK